MFNAVSIGSKGAFDALLLGVFGEKGKTLGLDDASRAAAAGMGILDTVKEMLSRTEATGDAGMLLEAMTATKGAKGGAKGGSLRVLIIGLGDKAKFEPGALRNAVANAARRIAAVKGTSLAIELDGVVRATKADASACGSCIGEGLGLLSWVCDQFRGKATTDPKRTKLAVRIGEGELLAGAKRGLGLAEAANLARTLSQTPPNVATPAYMADQAKKVARQTGLKFSMFEGDALKREKVGKASENKPCMIRLEYTPRGAARARSPSCSSARP
jgi:leucyl aminopeptidase